MNTVSTHTTDLDISDHARERMQTRNISSDDIELVIDHGRTFYARGAVFKIIGQKEASKHHEIARMGNLVGVHVILSHSGVVITAYRNRRFRRADFQKPRRRWARHVRQLRPWVTRNCKSR